MIGLPRRRVSTDARVAAWSLLVLLATAALEPMLGNKENAPSLAQGEDLMRAVVHAAVATLTLTEPIEMLGLDVSSVGLAIGEASARAPITIEGDTPGSRIVRLTYREGAGSEDAARLVLPDGREIVADVKTPPGIVPTPRIAARTAGPLGIAYVVGGATTENVASLAWQPLDSFIRVDVASGGIRTMGARLPSPRYDASLVWDPRPGDACPEGCVYVFGGAGERGQPMDEIVRYDPANDRADLLDARLPIAASGLVALFDGERAHLMGGGQPGIFRFDPSARTIETVGASALTSLVGLGGAFDPRASATCPDGCGYLFGGGIPVTRTTSSLGFDTPADQTRDSVLRYDAATGAVVALASTMPERRESPGVAWDGTRAIIVGGGGCAALLVCEYPSTVLAFDPATSTFETLPATLEPTMREATLVWRDGEAVIVAGVVGTASASEPLDRILRVRLR